jgi:hypothetical protein
MLASYAPINKKICGSGSVTMAAHDAVEPSVVKYFPPLPLWLGRLTGAGAHEMPDVVEDVAVRRYPSVPTAKRLTVSSATPTSRSPLALMRVPEIAEATTTAAWLAELAAEVALVAALDADVAALVALVAAACAWYLAEYSPPATGVLNCVAQFCADTSDASALVALFAADVADVAAAVADAWADAVNVATLR